MIKERNNFLIVSNTNTSRIDLVVSVMTAVLVNLYMHYDLGKFFFTVRRIYIVFTIYIYLGELDCGVCYSNNEIPKCEHIMIRINMRSRNRLLVRFITMELYKYTNKSNVGICCQFETKNLTTF